MRMLILHEPKLPTGSFEDEQTGLELAWRPEMDVFELPHEYLLSLSLPGVRPGNVEATAAGKSLFVSGERMPAIPDGAVAHLIESRAGRFERRVRLPADADLAGLRTEMADGQLLVRIPKAERRLVTRIEVNRRGG